MRLHATLLKSSRQCGRDQPTTGPGAAAPEAMAPPESTQYCSSARRLGCRRAHQYAATASHPVNGPAGAIAGAAGRPRNSWNSPIPQLIPAAAGRPSRRHGTHALLASPLRTPSTRTTRASGKPGLSGSPKCQVRDTFNSRSQPQGGKHAQR